jgi:hypothetical protein
MLNFLFYAPFEYQKKILLEFIKPVCTELINSEKIDAFDYVSTSKRLVLSTISPKDEVALEEEMKAKWSRFLESEASYFAPPTYTDITTLFREFPIQHLKVSKVSSSVAENTLEFNFSATNLEVLQELDDNDYDLEYSMCLLFTFIYCMGGYSPQKLLKTTEQLLQYKHFDAETQTAMNAQIDAIIHENKEAIHQTLNGLFHELLVYRSKDEQSSVFSTWKNSYEKITINNDEDLIPTFEHFKNQLLFSDSEVYMILFILRYFLANYSESNED